jgi:hypothetical protein
MARRIESPMRGQDARGRERSISSDRLFTSDVVKRAQRLLIGVRRLARCRFLGSMDSSVLLLALAVRALSRERVVAILAVSSCLAIGNSSPKPPTSGYSAIPCRRPHRRQPPASRSPTRAAARREIGQLCATPLERVRRKPSTPEPKPPTFTDPKIRSTSFRPPGHLQVVNDSSGAGILT